MKTINHKYLASLFILFQVLYFSTVNAEAENNKKTIAIPYYYSYHQRSIGQYLTLGHYEQDGNVFNGAEQIEWKILDIRENKALVISKYGLRTSYYGKDYVWSTSDIRFWLNHSFIDDAFTTKEKMAIADTLVDNSDAQNYGAYTIHGSDSTIDKLFILSYAEAKLYFGIENETLEGVKENISARVAPSEYARTTDSNSAAVLSDYLTAENETAGKWWLRSPGGKSNCVIYVSPTGVFGYNYTDTWRNLIRPAMWINLNAIE